jgi:hypothetical protein
MAAMEKADLQAPDSEGRLIAAIGNYALVIFKPGILGINIVFVSSVSQIQN